MVETTVRRSTQVKPRSLEIAELFLEVSASYCRPYNTKILSPVCTATITNENKSDVQGEWSSRQRTRRGEQLSPWALTSIRPPSDRIICRNYILYGKCLSMCIGQSHVWLSRFVRTVRK